jgi:hypothetical protein
MPDQTDAMIVPMVFALISAHACSGTLALYGHAASVRITRNLWRIMADESIAWDGRCQIFDFERFDLVPLLLWTGRLRLRTSRLQRVARESTRRWCGDAE